MKPRKLKPIKAGFDDEKIAFFPRMAFQSEREAVERQLAEITTETLERGRKIFEIKRDAIADWSTEAPKLLKFEKGEIKLSPLVEKIENAPDAMQKFFKDFTVENEELISRVYTGFLGSMSADIDFL